MKRNYVRKKRAWQMKAGVSRVEAERAPEAKRQQRRGGSRECSAKEICEFLRERRNENQVSSIQEAQRGRVKILCRVCRENEW